MRGGLSVMGAEGHRAWESEQGVIRVQCEQELPPTQPGSLFRLPLFPVSHSMTMTPPTHTHAHAHMIP